jgi:general secretion pathway protein M
MNANHPIHRYLKRYPSLATLIYVAFVMALALMTLLAVLDIGDRHRAVNASAQVLARLARQAPALASESNWTADSVPPGSPFLEGQTVTVASAALMQQITGAITAAGGRIVSSEVKPQGDRTGDAFIRVVANCELEEAALPHLLYGIEAGMPFLFIDQFVAEAPANQGERMHVLLGVSGLWLGTK